MACTLESVWEFRSPNICWFIFKLYFNLLRIWLLLCLLLMSFLCASHMTMLQEAQGWPLFVRFFTDISSQSSSVLDHERDYFYPTTHFLQVGGMGCLQSSLRFFHVSIAIHVNIRAKVWFFVNIDISVAFKKQKNYLCSNSGIYYS